MEDHPQARYIVQTLNRAGFIAYYAGGWVRDFLLKHPSDDIDIATNAPPETVQALFPHTVPIGIAFGIILVVVDGHPFEVATFRQDFDYKDGRRPAKIAFATAIEDAHRRDFTINGMFYDPLTEQVLDYVHGKEDLEKKIIRAIGNPHQRIQEDRLRMIRAVRLACRFGFMIEPATEAAIRAHAKELFPAVAIERIWQEFVKGHAFGKLLPMLLQLHEFGLLESIFPELDPTGVAERLQPTQNYPADAPVISFLLPLFPHSTLEQQIALCEKLKLSKKELQFVSFLFALRMAPPRDLFGWAHLYASDFAETALLVAAAHEDKEAYLREHRERQKKLQRAIQRIQQKDPVVKSSDLLQAGVAPGKRMGELLLEAEKISINEQIDEAEPILKKLFNS
jgi:poly(A) polymerase